MFGVVEQGVLEGKLMKEEWELFGARINGGRTFTKSFPGKVKFVILHCIVNSNNNDKNQKKGFPVDAWMLGETFPYNSGNHQYYWDFNEQEIRVTNSNEVSIEFSTISNHYNSWVSEVRYRKVYAYVYYE